MDDDASFPGTTRFEVRRRLGAGGMGVVYEAYDRNSRALVALKTIKQLTADRLLRFKQEFRAVQGIVHPNLVEIRELIEEQGRWFFTMELVEGGDILEYVRPARRSGFESEPTVPSEFGAPPAFHEERLRTAMGQLVQALSALHRAGKIHRDIKPGNIIVTPEGRLVVLDFGLATPADIAHQSTEAHTVGTADYMSPEQAAAKSVTAASDWYSVGVVLYKALTGRLPFTGSSIEVLMNKQTAEPTPPSGLVPTVPSDLDELCVKLLHFDPAARPSVREIIRALGTGDEPIGLGTSQFTETGLLVGREAEKLVLKQAFEDVRVGAPVSVVVHGESGIGKSCLLKAFAAELSAERGDVVTLAGRCYAHEQIPFKALDGVVDSLARYMRSLSPADAAALLPRGAALLPRMFPVLGRVESIAQSPRLLRPIKDQFEIRRRTFGALRELIHRISDRRSIVMVIDDLQWADADSLLLLGDLLRPPEPPPFLLLMSSRSTELFERAPGGGHNEPALPGRIELLHLKELDPEMSRVLAAALLQRASPDRSIDPDEIMREAGGHPMYIDELVRYVSMNEDPAGAHPRLDNAIWHRIQQLPDDARSLLELAAVAGAPVSTEVLQMAAQMDEATTTRRLSLLRAAHLMQGVGARDRQLVQPYHDRVRETVLARLSNDERRQRHDRLSIALESTGGRPDLLLRHLEASGQASRAAMYAERAAVKANEAFAFDQAVDFYKAAIRLGDYQEKHLRDLRIALSGALANAGRGAESAAAALAAAEGADRTTRLECKTRAAQQLLICGHIDPGIAALRELLQDVNVRMPKTPKRALAFVVWNRMRLRLRGLGWAEKHEKEIAESDLLRVDIYDVASSGLSMVDNVRGADFQVRGLRQALETGEPGRIARALCTEALYVGSQGGRGFKRAAMLVAEADRIVASGDSPFLNAWAHMTHGILAYFQGEFVRAGDMLREAIDMLREETTGRIWELNNARVFRLFALRHQGRIATMRSLYGDYVRDAALRGDRYVETSLRLYASSIFLASDDPSGAYDNLNRAFWTPPEGRFHLQHWYELEARGEAALYEGKAAEALVELAPRFAGLEGSLLTRIQIVRCLSYSLKGKLLVAAASSEARDGHLSAAVRIAGRLEREKIRFATVWAAMIRAGAARKRHDDEEAARWLRTALEHAQGARMAFHVACCQYLLSELGDDDAAALRERAVAWMTEQTIENPQAMVRVIAPGHG